MIFVANLLDTPSRRDSSFSNRHSSTTRSLEPGLAMSVRVVLQSCPVRCIPVVPLAEDSNRGQANRRKGDSSSTEQERNTVRKAGTQS